MEFQGEFQHTLDDKGRMVLPAAFRERLSTGVVLVKGHERTVNLWPVSAYERRVAEARESIDRNTKRGRAQFRILMAGHKQVPDSQGRIVVPAALREYAHLDRDLLVLGHDDNVEIWDRARYDAYLDEIDEEFSEYDEGAGE